MPVDFMAPFVPGVVQATLWLDQAALFLRALNSRLRHA